MRGGTVEHRLDRVCRGLDAPGVEPRHAVIEAQGENLTLRALAPLRLNDQPVAAGGRVPLRTGDLLTLGQTDFALLRV